MVRKQHYTLLLSIHSLPFPISEYNILTAKEAFTLHLYRQPIHSIVRHCNGLHVCWTLSTHVKTISGRGRYYGCKVCVKDRPSAPSWCPTLLAASSLEHALQKRGEAATRVGVKSLDIFYTPLGSMTVRRRNFLGKIGCLVGGVMCARCFITLPLFLQANLSPP